MPRNGCVKMINETMLQGFEWYLPADGKHWQKLSRMAHWLAFRGFTAVWGWHKTHGGWKALRGENLSLRDRRTAGGYHR